MRIRSPGYDQYPINIVKTATTSVAEPLLHNFKFIFYPAHIPLSLKYFLDHPNIQEEVINLSKKYNLITIFVDLISDRYFILLRISFRKTVIWLYINIFYWFHTWKFWYKGYCLFVSEQRIWYCFLWHITC